MTSMRAGQRAGLSDAGRLVDLDSVTSGARWTRVDFHLHTPGVNSFACPSGVNLGDPAVVASLSEQYADRLAEAGIEIAAITDYNGIREEWYVAIKDAAATRGITVLPGAELSIREGKGLHILLIFPLDSDVREINECLRSLDKKPGRALFEGRGHDEIDLTQHVHDALIGLRERFGCLLIPAHVSDNKGVIKELGGKAAAELIQAVNVDALEHASPAARGQLASANVLTNEELANLACVEFSDPRGLDDIGGKQLADGSPRGTWVKLSSPDLGALRLALHDPRTRLTTKPPLDPAHPRLLRTEVVGSGFLGNLTIEWNPDLNTLVGGRGAGKSAILESIRYALDLPVYSEDHYRADSVRHAIGSGGTITLLVERPGETSGKRYRIRRVFGEAPEVFEDGGVDALGIPPRDVFGPDAEPIVLLQREIQEVSRDDTFRLRLLDVLVGEAAESAAKRVAATRSALETNGAKLHAAHARADQKAELDEKGRSLDAEVAFFDDQGVSLKLDRHAKIQKDESALKRARKLVQDESTGAWLTELNGLTTRFDNVHKRLGQLVSEHADELAGSLGTIEQVIADIAAAQVLLSESLGKAGQALDALGVDWALVTAPLRDELLRLEQELGNKLEPERYLQLLREKDELLPKLQAVEGATGEIQSLTQERLGLLRRLGEQRLEENRLRRETADQVNQRLEGKLRIEIGYKGQTDAWRTTLTAFFRGSGVTAEALNRLVAPDSTDGAQLAAAALGGAKDVVAAFDVTTAMADKVVDWLTAEHGKRLHELQLLAPDDSVSVQLIVDGQPRSLDHLSMGQRATAILLLLFALEARLLILDQPEDDLDQRFVFEDIVGLLRSQKGLSEPFARRQVIAATHNPNIPVLGDAEQVLALQADEGRVAVRTRSSIDDSEVRILLRAILEGGAEAFRRRAEKYGGVE